MIDWPEPRHDDEPPNSVEWIHAMRANRREIMIAKWMEHIGLINKNNVEMCALSVRALDNAS